jgi:hypothetical protein
MHVYVVISILLLIDGLIKFVELNEPALKVDLT